MIKLKDSGIEWIGQIPSHWQVLRHKDIMKKIKDICEKYNGEDILSLSMKGVLKRDLNNPSGKMPTTFDGYQRVKRDNLLLCLFDIDVTPRCVGLIKDDGLTSPAYSQFQMKKGDFTSYYNYLLTMIDDNKSFLHLSKNLRSSLTEDDFGAIPTVRPTFNEQVKIAKYLDEKCEKIDKLIKLQNEQLERLKEYKLNFITEIITKGIKSKASLKDSGIEWIGQIPSHWQVLRMKNIGKCFGGLTYSPEDVCNEGEGTLVLRSSNIKEGQLVFTDNVYVKQKEGIPFVKKGDIFICSRNGSRELIGKNAYIDKDYPYSFGAFMMVFRPNKGTNPLYIQKILSSQIFKYYLGTFLTATINQLTKSNFDNMKIVYCPNIEEQEEIVKHIENKTVKIESLIKEKEKKIAKLQDYKKSLIYECVTGKKEI